MEEEPAPSPPVKDLVEREEGLAMSTSPVTSQEEGEMMQECVTPSLSASHVRLSVSDGGGGACFDVKRRGAAAKQSTPASLSGQSSITSEGSGAGLSPASSLECSGGPRFDAAIEDSTRSDFSRQNTSSSSGSSGTGAVSIDVQLGPNPSIQYKLEGCEDETVRKCSTDAASMVQHMAAMTLSGSSTTKSSTASSAAAQDFGTRPIHNLHLNSKINQTKKIFSIIIVS